MLLWMVKKIYSTFTSTFSQRTMLDVHVLRIRAWMCHAAGGSQLHSGSQWYIPCRQLNMDHYWSPRNRQIVSSKYSGQGQSWISCKKIAGWYIYIYTSHIYIHIYMYTYITLYIYIIYIYIYVCVCVPMSGKTFVCTQVPIEGAVWILELTAKNILDVTENK